MAVSVNVVVVSSLAAFLICVRIRYGGNDSKQFMGTNSFELAKKPGARVQGVVLVGSGSDQTMRSYNLEANASLSETWVNDTIKTDGAPFWMVYGTTPSRKDHCVWVMLNDVSELVSYEYSSGAMLQKRSIVYRTDAFSLRSPVHGSVSSDGRTLVVAYINEPPHDGCNSTGAGVASFRILDDCGLSLQGVIPHNGSSIIKDFQCSAHPHGCTAWRNNLVFCNDRGMDAIFTYKAQSNSNITELSRISVQAGQGPRHSVTHPTLPLLYTLTEQGSSILVHKIDEEGVLTAVSNITALAPAYPGTYASDVLISPDGRFLYASNRGFSYTNSTIAVFNVSTDGKALTLTQHKVLPSYPQSVELTTLAQYCDTDGVCKPNVNMLLIPYAADGSITSVLLGADGTLLDTLASVVGPPTAQSILVLPCSVGETC